MFSLAGYLGHTDFPPWSRLTLGVLLASETWVGDIQIADLPTLRLTITPGGPMALNLQRKSPASDELLVYDTNISAAEKVVREASGKSTIAADLALISQGAVRKASNLF